MQPEEGLEVAIIREAQAIGLRAALDQSPQVAIHALPLCPQVRQCHDVGVTRGGLPAALDVGTHIAHRAAALEDQAVIAEGLQVPEQDCLYLKVA